MAGSKENNKLDLGVKGLNNSVWKPSEECQHRWKMTTGLQV